MRHGRALILAVFVVAVGSAPHGQAQQAEAASDVVAHALRVEQRAARASFAELDSFGAAARQRRDAEGLSRLQHVTRIVVNQGDFPAATRWNAQLREAAQAQHNPRYLALVEINAAQIRHLRDRNVSIAELQAIAGAQQDWLTQVSAQLVLARRLLNDSRVGEALRLLARAIAQIPAERAQEASIAAAAWDVVAIAHVMVDDVPGHLKAIEKAESYMVASAYPRPDYESVYNLAQSLSYLGRHDEARQLAAIYGRLAARTNTATALGYAGNICAFAASSREDWKAVLACLAPYGAELAVPDVVRNSMLPFRATALARTGQLAPAQRDIDEIRRLVAAKLISSGGGTLRAEAELLIAKGEYGRGVPMLREYHLARFQRAVRSSAAAMEQVVSNIDDQLQSLTEQNRLKNEIITSHRVLAASLSGMGAVLLVLVVVLARERRRYRLQAITDPLTGLANRRYTEQRLGEIVAHAVERSGKAVVVLMDLDHFKSCNDSFGHDAGDEALRTFAGLVAANVRPGDVFGRWGGEEFLLVLPDAGLDEARALVQRIAATAAGTTLALAPAYPLRFSGGAVAVPAAARSPAEVLLRADELLYTAKKAGRNRVHCSDQD